MPIKILRAAGKTNTGRENIFVMDDIRALHQDIRPAAHRDPQPHAD